MRLDQELVRRKLCESRQEAQEMIQSSFVLVDGIISTKQTKQVTTENKIEVLSKRKYVSRGGEKLEGVLLDVFGDEEKVRGFCSAKTALDIGSSTGGFTDCLLSHGVVHIDAVDVGTAQLHNSLLQDPRITLYENTDIRTFAEGDARQSDIIVGDVSFISLEQILPAVMLCARKGTFIFLLIKPQFEVGKGNTKKGIVKDGQLVQSILNKYKHEVESLGVSNVTLFPSHLVGGDGNQEYFLYGILKY